MRPLGLRTKLTLGFLVVSVVLFAALFVYANYLLEGQFRNYVIDKQERQNRSLVALLAERHADWGGVWDPDGLESVGVSALDGGLILRVVDADGTTVWDARTHNDGACTALLSHLASNMLRLDPRFEGGYAEASYPVVSAGAAAGTAVIGYYGPYAYSDNDLRFLQALNEGLAWGAALSAAAALLLGALAARQVVRPIQRAIRVTQEIGGGRYEARIEPGSGSREIADLSVAVNGLAESLGVQEALRRRLTADMAHELRTPVATLQIHLEAMVDGLLKPDRAQLESLHHEVVRIARMVGDLDRLNRQESGDLSLHESDVELSELLQGLVALFRAESRQRGVDLSLEAVPCLVRADEDKLRQVFANLITNALKYTPEGGRVVVRIACGAAEARVSVEDTGIGIAAEDLPHVFERFYRTDRSRSRTSGGAGIGLSIARALVAAHGGEIRAESRPGGGSTFTVLLPKDRRSASNPHNPPVEWA